MAYKWGSASLDSLTGFSLVSSLWTGPSPNLSTGALLDPWSGPSLDPWTGPSDDPWT